MARQLDPKIATVLKDHGFGADAAWDCHGVWVVYHRVLEQIAAGAGIKMELPTIVEANSAAGIAAVCVAGSLGEMRVWSIGEASPKNNKNAYCWAMAEKRAVDRVILKLIGLHGLAYSEEESDDFKSNGSVAPDALQTGNPPGITKFRAAERDFLKELHACTDYDEYCAFVKSAPARDFMTTARDNFPKDWNGDGGDIFGLKKHMEEFCGKLKADKKEEAFEL